MSPARTRTGPLELLLVASAGATLAALALWSIRTPAPPGHEPLVPAAQLADRPELRRSALSALSGPGGSRAEAVRASTGSRSVRMQPPPASARIERALRSAAAELVDGHGDRRGWDTSLAARAAALPDGALERLAELSVLAARTGTDDARLVAITELLAASEAAELPGLTLERLRGLVREAAPGLLGDAAARSLATFGDARDRAPLVAALARPMALEPAAQDPASRAGWALLAVRSESLLAELTAELDGPAPERVLATLASWCRAQPRPIPGDPSRAATLAALEAMRPSLSAQPDAYARLFSAVDALTGAGELHTSGLLAPRWRTALDGASAADRAAASELTTRLLAARWQRSVDDQDPELGSALEARLLDAELAATERVTVAAALHSTSSGQASWARSYLGRVAREDPDPRLRRRAALALSGPR